MSMKDQHKRAEKYMLDMQEFENAINDKYVWPGGYQMHLVMYDSEAICMDCANDPENKKLILEATAYQDRSGWHCIGIDVHWEGPPMQCAHCNGDIESAYGDPDA